MKKIYTKNNYLIIEWPMSAPLMRPKKNIFFFRSSVNLNQYMIKDSLQSIPPALETVLWTDFVKEDNTPFANITDFNDWVTANTGNFNQGSNPGTFVPANHDLAEFKNNSSDKFVKESKISNIDNTSDLEKPISNTTQSALNDKQDKLSSDNLKTFENKSLLGAGNIEITKEDVGLSNVDNTSDLNKPVSSVVQSALDGKQNNLVSGTNIKTIEGQNILGSGNIDLNKSDVGLNNVDNTNDLSKPISSATQTALNLKVDKSGVKVLTDVNYSSVDKAKLDALNSAVFGLPTPRTPINKATAYQALNPLKPAIITITLNATSNATLTVATNNAANILIGSTNAVATGTGTIIGKYNNTLSLGVLVSTGIANTYTIALPAGWYFAILNANSTTGVTIDSVLDQTIG